MEIAAAPIFYILKMVATSPNPESAAYCVFSTNTSSIFSCTFHFSVACVFCLSYLKAHEKQSHCACSHTRFGSVFFSLVIATLLLRQTICRCHHC